METVSGDEVKGTAVRKSWLRPIKWLSDSADCEVCRNTILKHHASLYITNKPEVVALQPRFSPVTKIIPLVSQIPEKNSKGDF